MIICPACKHLEFQGAIFCSECGESLRELGDAQNVTLFPSPNDQLNSDGSGIIEKDRLTEELALQSICIQFIKSGDSFLMQKNIPVIIGRSTNDQPILPDIDLANQNAQSYGVSRLHVEFVWNDDGVFVNDLGSANGTKVNGLQIRPHIQVRVNIGDIVELGKMHCKIKTC